MPNLVITIEGGVMCGVVTDDDPTTPVRLILIDNDNIEQGDDPNGVEFNLEIDISQATEIFAAHDSAPTHLSGPNGCEDGCPACEPTPPKFGPPINVNVLEGLRCPKCGSEDQFGITCLTVATVADDGIDEYGDMEWEPTSGMSCQGYNTDGNPCDFAGTVADFTIGETND